jgi:protein arginine N-methyltransferase 1
MIADHPRIEAFANALRVIIRPGDIVMDIGTGPGIIAVLACQLGASRVYAIEPDEIIQVAREVAASNHCADKIEFFEKMSTQVTVPVRADVIISDMRGILPLFEQHIPSIIDARRRLLSPGGTLIARKDRIWTAVVEAPEVHGEIVDAWDHNIFEQDLGVARRRVLNQFRRAKVKPNQLLTAPQVWATLDYTTIESSDTQATLCWKAQRNGIGHGFLVWFDMDLADGVMYSSDPASPKSIYGMGYFPWLEPVPLVEGQNISIDLEAKFLENDYFWRWTTEIESIEKPGEICTRFEQSQLQASVQSLAKLHKSASDFIPQLSEDGRMHRRSLELVDGKTSLEQIAKCLTAEFPGRFSCWQQALSFAASASRNHCE